jgi:hypothetical protein
LLQQNNRKDALKGNSGTGRNLPITELKVLKCKFISKIFPGQSLLRREIQGILLSGTLEPARQSEVATAVV